MQRFKCRMLLDVARRNLRPRRGAKLLNSLIFLVGRVFAPDGVAGLSTIRGLIGGFFLACVSMLALGLASYETIWFLAVAILMGVVVIGRVVGIVADGFDKAVVPPLIVEQVIGGVLVTAHVVLRGA